MDYYNTTELEPEQVKRYTKKAVSQDDAILEYFRSHPFDSGLTPSDINNAVLPLAPITSVRRAMTNLTNAGVLVKTSELRTGPYGRPEGVWKLSNPVQLECF